MSSVEGGLVSWQVCEDSGGVNMGTGADFGTELNDRMHGAVQRMIIPDEYYSVFFRLFSTYLILSYLDRLLEDYKKPFGSKVEELIDGFQETLTILKVDQLQAMRELGSPSAEMSEFLTEIESLKRFCDDHRELRRSLSS